VARLGAGPAGEPPRPSAHPGLIVPERDDLAATAAKLEHEPERARFGCIGHTLYRDADDPNSVTVLLDYESRERADEFMNDPSLREAMERGGVISEPLANWLDEQESCEYAARRAA
jgi:quinol monooxygenase YgiN